MLFSCPGLPTQSSPSNEKPFTAVVMETIEAMLNLGAENERCIISFSPEEQGNRLLPNFLRLKISFPYPIRFFYPKAAVSRCSFGGLPDGRPRQTGRTAVPQTCRRKHADWKTSPTHRWPDCPAASQYSRAYPVAHPLSAITVSGLNYLPFCRDLVLQW